MALKYLEYSDIFGKMEIHHVKKSCHQGSMVSAKVIVAQRAFAGVDVSSKTVVKGNITVDDYEVIVPPKKNTLLKQHHIVAQLKFAHNHLKHDVFWKSVIWSDETNKDVAFIWNIKGGKAFNPKNTGKRGGGSIRTICCLCSPLMKN